MVAPPVLPNTGRLNLRPASRDLANLATRATTEKTAARFLRRATKSNASARGNTATSLEKLADLQQELTQSELRGRVLSIPTVSHASVLDLRHSAHHDLRARGYWVKT